MYLCLLACLLVGPRTKAPLLRSGTFWNCPSPFCPHHHPPPPPPASLSRPVVRRRGAREKSTLQAMKRIVRSTHFPFWKTPKSRSTLDTYFGLHQSNFGIRRGSHRWVPNWEYWLWKITIRGTQGRNESECLGRKVVAMFAIHFRNNFLC